MESKRGHKRVRRRVIRTLSIVLVVILLLPFLLYGGVALYLKPERLTRIVNNICAQYINADIQIDTITLSMFSEFPDIGLRLRGGSVISRAFDDTPDSLRSSLSVRADSLLQFKEIVASVSLPSILKMKLNIKGIRFDEPNIYAYVSKWGKANWDIFPESDDEESSMSINVKRISISNAKRIAYNDRSELIYVNASASRIMLRGDFGTGEEGIRLDRIRANDLMMLMNLEPEQFAGRIILDSLRVGRDNNSYSLRAKTNISAQIDGVKYTSRAPVTLSGKISYDSDSGRIIIDDSMIGINDVPIQISGEVDMSAPDIIMTAIDLRSEAFSFSKVLDLLPAESFPDIKKISTDISADIALHIRGGISSITGELPVIDASVEIPGGYLRYTDVPSYIQNFVIEGDLHLDPNNMDNSWLSIDDLNIVAPALDLSADGELTDLMGDMKFDGSLRGSADLDSLNRMFSFTDDIVAKGRLSIGVITDIKLSQLSLAGIAKSRLLGSIIADSLDVRVPSEDIFLIAGASQMTFSSQEESEDIFGGDMPMTSISFSSDTLNIRYGTEMNFAASRFEANVGSDLAKIGSDDFTKIPLKTDITSERMNISLADSLWVRAQDFNGKVSITPAANGSQAEVSLVANVSRMMLRDLENRAMLMAPYIRINGVQRLVSAERRSQRGDDNSSQSGIRSDRVASSTGQEPYRVIGGPLADDPQSGEAPDRRLSFRQRRLDSLQMLYPDVMRDSLIVHNRRVTQQNRARDEFAASNIDLSIDKSLADILRNWSISGEISARGGRITTPYFPLSNRIEGMDVEFSNDSIAIKRAEIRAGASNMRITGSISNLQRALTSGRTLKIGIDIASDSLDINQLLKTSMAGVLYSDKNETEKSQISSIEDEDMTEVLLTEAETTESSLIVIPSNIDMSLTFDLNNAIYSGLALNKFTGEILAKNRTLKLNDIAVTSSGGDLNLTALYATRNKNDIIAGFDLELKNVEVDKFIDLIPAVDSLLPMLKSFEGVLNCGIAATAQLDTMMNIIFPSINGVCRISGRDMVLLDGETFAQISKMLMFKNKQRNMVDDIAVEIVIQNDSIEVFPFLMTIDRYQAAVSGIQDFDMNFVYHISVLKSPLPLRFGITFTGTPADFKFKLGRALYKNTDLPVYTHVIDQSIINLRKELNDIFQRGIDQMTNRDFSRIRINSDLAREINELSSELGTEAND